MVKAVLMIALLLPLLGTPHVSTDQPNPFAQHELGQAAEQRFWDSELPAAPERSDLVADESPPALPARLGASDRAAQRAEAIKKPDPALLPICSPEELTNRPDLSPVKSMEPWDYPEQIGCHLPPPRPDQIVPGPPSGSGVRQMNPGFLTPAN